MDKKYSAQSKIFLAVLFMVVAINVAGCGTPAIKDNDDTRGQSSDQTGQTVDTDDGQVDPVVTTTVATSTPSVSSTPVTTTSSGSGATMVASAYKDGTYTAVGEYNSPGGHDTMGVSLTLKNSKVVDTSVEVKAINPISTRFQNMFSDNYKQFVVGKSIESLSLGKISGSSLTPEGFNDAVQKIKAQAHS